MLTYNVSHMLYICCSQTYVNKMYYINVTIC